MKKFITGITMFVFGLFLSGTVAHAQAVFNSPGAMPTLTVSNSTRTTCQFGAIDGCWKASAQAQPGDVIAVHVFYHNTSNTAAQGTTLSIKPQSSGATTSVTFTGGVASLSGPRAVGSASVSISSSQTVEYIPGSGKWYPSRTSGPRTIDASALFGTGFNIGTVNPNEQGVLIAFFKIGNDGGGGGTYQCNDGADNDWDGYTDYPNDPGCSSLTDNYEGDDQQSQCLINSFYASPTNVSSGGYTTLYWSTSGCTYVTVDGVNYPVTSSGSFGPLYSGRTYELRAWRNNNAVQTRTAYVGVNQINPTYACNDGYDNDSDGRVDYPNDPGCYGYNDNDESDGVIINNNRPQAITTVATITSSTSARLSGIAVPNYSGTSSAWFEWGTTGSLGSRTNTQTVTGSGSTYISDTVSGLVPGTVYYYRTVVQNQNGTAYGDIVRFQTRTTVVVDPQPPRVITRVVQRDVVVAQSAPSLLELRVENVYDRMCVGGEMEYTVTYRNISNQTLREAVLRVVHPKELTFINASRGDYEVVDRALTIPLGDLSAGETGSVVVRTRVNNEAIRGNVAVLTAQVVYTNTNTKAQEDAIAYSLVNISDECPNQNVLGASAFGIGSFFPTTLLGWLILILIILALIVLGRQLYKKKTV